MLSGITSTTPKNIILDAGVVYLNYGLAGERILGATEGGSKFTVDRDIVEIKIDGAMGKVKGMRRITKENATLTTNLKEMSTANIQLALAGSTTAAPTLNTAVQAEYLGLGTAAAETFTFKHTPISGTEKFYVDGVLQNWKQGTQYTLTGATVTIIGIDTIALNAVVTAGYVWNSGGAATHDVITSPGTIADSDYKDNMALVATVSGSANPCIIIVKNVISDGKFEVGLKDKDEGVVALTLSAHYDPANLATPPWEIRYPRTIG